MLFTKWITPDYDNQIGDVTTLALVKVGIRMQLHLIDIII